MAKRQGKHNERGYNYMVHYVHNYHNPIAMILFFVFLLFSFFVPHDQELFLEFYWAAALLLLMGYRMFIQRKTSVLPRRFLLLWGAAILALFVTTATSRSIASSLVTILRFIEGAVIFFLMIDNRAHYNNARAFSNALLTTGKTTILIFFLLICFPFFSGYIPSYNGIVAANGHHPIAYLLVALLPTALLFSVPRRVGLYIQSIIIFLALILSAARGAWIVTAAFFAVKVARIKGTYNHFFTFMVLGLLAAAFSGMFWLSLLPYDQKMALTRMYPQLGMFSKESNHSLRFAYIQEAIRAIQDKPIFGHGPGTFHLLSRQYATSSVTYARFAHSLPFEVLAENGLIGTIPIAILFGAVFFSLLSVLRTSNNTPQVALAWGALLLLFYSMIETTLNNLSIWLLFWAITGQAIPHTSPITRRLSEIASIIVFVILLAFIVSYTAARIPTSTLMLTQSVDRAPYVKSNILRHINELNAEETNRLTPIILTWYNKDPDIYQALARSSHPLTATKYYEKALRYHPHNNGYLKEYLTLLMNNNDKKRIGATICYYSQLYRRQVSEKLCEYLLRSSSFTRYINTGAFYSALDYLQGTDGKAKFYYFLGLSVFKEQQDTEGATLLWQAARDIAPEWGFYHLELASAYYYWYDDKEKANIALSICEKNSYTKAGCKSAISNLINLLEPGLRAPDINAIPTILPQ